MPEEKQSDSKVYTDDRMELWDIYDRQITQEFANYNTLGGTGEKACANCQWYIAPSGCVVVQSSPEPIVPNGLSNQWKERVRPTSMIPIPVVVVDMPESQSAINIIGEKQETKTEGGIEYKASDFAVVPDADTPSTWKLRLAEDQSGDFTIAQVARAITAMQPGGFRGNRVQLTTDEKSQAVTSIGSAIGKTNGTDEQKANLHERLDDVKETSITITMPRSLKAMFLSKLTTVLDAVRGTVAAPLDVGTGQSFVTFKDMNDQWRWFSWTSNKYRDRDNPPEIFEDSAHKDYVR